MGVRIGRRKRSAKSGTGAIKANIPIEPDQIQPASLDLRLGERAFRVPASFLPGSGRLVSDRLSELATHEVDLTRPQVLERNCVHIIPLLETLELGIRLVRELILRAPRDDSIFLCD